MSGQAGLVASKLIGYLLDCALDIDLVADEFGLEGWRMLDVDLVAEQIVLIAPSGQVLQFDVAVTVDTSPL